MKTFIYIITGLAIWATVCFAFEAHDQANRNAYAEAYNCKWGWSGSHYLCK